VKRNARPRRRTTLLFAAFVICAVVLGARIMRKYELSRMKPSPPPQTQEAGAVLVTLFFASPDGVGLMREAREIDACSDPEECAEEVMDELVNGPVGNMSPTLPPSATIRSVRLEGETALVDLGKEFVAGLPSGSNAEMMAVYSVVDSLSFNFPRIKRVRFLVEGANTASLGHLDLREPLVPDFTLERKQKSSATDTVNH
jgi:hypothetical protein